jgi:hypothetical protein
MTRDFCTYFDSHYLTRGLSLYLSLREHCPSFRLWVLCMDTSTTHCLKQLALPQVIPVGLEELEAYDSPLLVLKGKRSKIEYYFTCTPSLPLYILSHWPETPMVSYLDADLFFYHDPAPIFDEIGGCSIALMEHRYAPNLRHRLKYGRFNVGWLSFRNDDHGHECLQWWRERCLEWCYDRVEGDRYADQKYLDLWPGLFTGLRIVRHKGANLAPWNISRYSISRQAERVCVDEVPLIFFHFHGFEQIAPWLYDPHFAGCRARMTKDIKFGIFAPYIQALLSACEMSSACCSTRKLPPGIRIELNRIPFSQRVWTLLDKALCATLSTVRRNYILVRNGRVL